MDGVLSLEDDFAIERDGAGIRITVRSGAADFAFRVPLPLYILINERGRQLIEEIAAARAEVIAFPGRG